jgi:hypothetical protein
MLLFYIDLPKTTAAVQNCKKSGTIKGGSSFSNIGKG